jgi:PHD/YefM family antitoxin component YafN of YafNO toxin-antitoxin module
MKTSEILQAVEEDVVQITNHNLPAAAMLSWTAYRTLLDTFDALVDPDLNRSVRQGIAEFYRKEVTPWEEIREKMGLPR